MKPLRNVVTPDQAMHASSVEVDSSIPQFHLLDLGVDGDGKRIDWPSAEGYDAESRHGVNTAKLALVILSHSFPSENFPKQQAVLWTAALFHDIGRTEDFRTEDPGHTSRSVHLLECILKNPQHDVHHNVELREAACRLVANHNLNNPELPTEPLAQCLWDADAIESCRIRPNTHDGLQYMKKRTKPERLCTPWARDRSNLKRFMHWRGW